MYDLHMILNPTDTSDAAEDLRTFVNGRRFGTILADPPWQFQNRTGKVAPEHKRLSRYDTLNLAQIKRFLLYTLQRLYVTSTCGYLTPCFLMGSRL
jgi:hypothetical protein